MIVELKRKGNIGIRVAIGTNIVGLTANYLGVPVIPPFLMLLAVAIWIWAMAQYAAAEGHSVVWGVLAGLIPIFLLVLIFLPDRHKLPAIGR